MNIKKKMIKKLKTKVVFSLLIIILISFSISFIASKGCCFNPTNGECSRDSEESACVNPGEFSQDSQCSISECEKGCCMLGYSAEYVTFRQCQIDSSRLGFELSFQNGIDIRSCTMLGQA